MSSESSKITLRTSDGQLFDVDKAVAMESEAIKAYFDNEVVSNHTVVPLPNVTSNALLKVVHYCKKHMEFRSNAASRDNVFEADFVNQDNVTIIKLIHAANYLNIKNLLDLLCQHVADTIKDKSVEQVRLYFGIENDFTAEEREIREQRLYFGIENDFTAEEEQDIREQNRWAFE